MVEVQKRASETARHACRPCMRMWTHVVCLFFLLICTPVIPPFCTLFRLFLFAPASSFSIPCFFASCRRVVARRHGGRGCHYLAWMEGKIQIAYSGAVPPSRASCTWERAACLTFLLPSHFFFRYFCPPPSSSRTRRYRILPHG